MNCPNCGAPMSLLDDRPGWQCSHCSTVVRPESPTTDDGLRVLGADVRHHRECPVCHRPLLAATMDDFYRIDTCSECKGLLIPLPVFATTIVAKRRMATNPSVTPGHVSTRELQRNLACPSCGRQMITDWYYGPGRIVMDRCEDCQLVWLDRGELQRVIDAPGPDRRA